MKNYTKDNLLSVDKEILKPGMLALQAGDTTFVLTNICEKKEEVIVEKLPELYKCVSVDTANKMWKGCKAVYLDELGWSFDDNEVELSYGNSLNPVVGKVYDANATLRIGSLFKKDVLWETSIFALKSSSGINEIINNIEPETTDEIEEILSNGEFCFDGSRYLKYIVSIGKLNDFTVEFDVKVTGESYGYAGLCCNHTSWTTDAFIIQWGRYGAKPSLHWNSGSGEVPFGNDYSSWINDGKYHHIAVVKSGNNVNGYIDGQKFFIGTTTRQLDLSSFGGFVVGGNTVDHAYFPGRIKHFRIFDKAIYDDSFDDSLPSWVGEDY